MDREHIVGIPEPLGMIAIDDRLDFVGDVADGPAPMRFAEHGAAAPGAGVRAAAGGDERHRADAVALAPRVEVRGQVDGVAIGIAAARRDPAVARGLACARTCSSRLERDAVNLATDPDSADRPAQAATVFERLLAFADHHDVGAGVQVRLGVVRRIGSAEDDLRAALLRAARSSRSAFRLVIRLTAMPTTGGRSRSSVAP